MACSAFDTSSLLPSNSFFKSSMFSLMTVNRSFAFWNWLCYFSACLLKPATTTLAFFFAFLDSVSLLRASLAFFSTKAWVLFATNQRDSSSLNWPRHGLPIPRRHKTLEWPVKKKKKRKEKWWVESYLELLIRNNMVKRTNKKRRGSRV